MGFDHGLLCVDGIRERFADEARAGVHATPPLVRTLIFMDLTPSIWIKETDFPRREIRSVPDAVQFLDTWPDDKRDPFFDLAKNALQGAINGAIPVVEARDAFETFCREAGILTD